MFLLITVVPFLGCGIVFISLLLCAWGRYYFFLLDKHFLLPYDILWRQCLFSSAFLGVAIILSGWLGELIGVIHPG